MQYSAIGGGLVSGLTSNQVISKGVCWNTTGNPTLTDTFTVDGFGGGSFSSTLTNLNPNTTYYVRAYASDTITTVYGGEVNFTTLPLASSVSCPGTPTVTDYEGNVYNTVLIGNQCWMKENLRSSHLPNGTALTLANNDSIWTDFQLLGNTYCYYNNDSANAIQYGALYNWFTIMNGATGSNTVPSGVQGICPAGWHIPSDEEWKILEGEVDSMYGYPNTEWDNALWRGYDAGQKLKSTSDWSFGGNGTDAYGFTALPGGFRSFMGGYGYLNIRAYFWTSTDLISGIAFYRYLNFGNDDVYSDTDVKGFGRSVRCLKD